LIEVELAIDEALGPGLDVAVENGEPRVVGARPGAIWLGLDRGHLLDSDAGNGTEVPALVALPASSFAGCRIAAELAGALVDGDRAVVVARMPGWPMPPEAVIRTVARMSGGHWVDAAAADRLVREARQRHRVRRQSGRVLGGRAWQPSVSDPGERRFTTPHSRSEYRLERLPPRFIRGLEGLLDTDERILYAIERPPDAIATGRFGLARRGAERRAGLLLLTDRQLIWMIDHMPPDRYLFDWGVDARLIALEALRGVHSSGREVLELRVSTSGGPTTLALPSELHAEVDVMVDLLQRFVPTGGTHALMRRYGPAAVDFDSAVAAAFGQVEEAERHVGALREHVAPENLLAAFYAPRRETVRHDAAVGITTTRLVLLDGSGPHSIGLAALRDIAITLSPLVGRVTAAGVPSGSHGALQPAAADHGHEVRAHRGDAHPLTFSYPAPASAAAATFIRILRKAWADCASS
jgi:hypothetical protein